MTWRAIHTFVLPLLITFLYMATIMNRVLLLSALIGQTLAVNNGLARTPQMGWNNWNSLGCDVSEELLLGTAQKLVTLGLRDMGYNYVVLDDCWSDGRDAVTGRINVDLERFPNGMKFVSDHMHSQGFLYGMYSSAGHLTCARYEGSLDHETEDAQSFADWGVDYLKYDNCYNLGRMGTGELSFKRYNDMAIALNKTGRPMLYSLCSWGEDFVNSWGTSISNSYRISGDIYDSFSRPDDLCSCTTNDPSAPFCVAPGSRCSVLTILNRVAPYVDRSQPGGWQDLDMLEVGHGGMTDEEYKAHFALWAAVKSPLLIGADIRHLNAEGLTILNSPAIIALSQDPLGRPATRVARDLNVPKDRFGIGETQVWSGVLYGGDQALILLNAADKDQTMTAYLEDIFVGEGPGGSAPQNDDDWTVHDLWADRMTNGVAQKIVDSDSDDTTAKILREINWFNSSETSFKAAILAGDERLMGKKVSEIKRGGKFTAKVKRHSAMVYRLRSATGKASKRYGTSRDEL